MPDPVSPREREALEDLQRLVPPQGAPLVLLPAWWSAVEAALGTPLPADYRALVARYGDRFGRGYRLLTPFADGENNLNAAADRAARVLRERAAQLDPRLQRFPYRLYPEPGGLLLWGEDEAGTLLFWLTQGPPDEWPTVAVEPASLRHERFDLPVSAFLAAVLRGRLHSRVLPGALPWPEPAGGQAN